MWFLFLKNWLILWWLSTFLISCGYHFHGRPSYFKPEWKTIYISPWKNFTTETFLGELLAYELRHKFAQGRFLIPVFEEAQADLVLKGEVIRVYLEPVAYETFIQTRERKISFKGRYQLIERKENKVIAENLDLNRYEIYRVPLKGATVIDPGREEALRLLVKDLAEVVFHEIIFR